MGTDQAEILSKRLRDVGFSDRAIGMIIDEVSKLDIAKESSSGLSESVATYDEAMVATPSKKVEELPPTTSTFVISGAVLLVLSLLCGWSTITNGGGSEVAIMTGTASGPSWLQGIQALLLSAWIAVPPLWSAWKGNAVSRFRDTPTLAVWAGMGLAMATLLLTSTS